MRLHLGCGSQILAEYVNIDLYSEKADIKDDIILLEQLKSGVYEEILTNHTLEHLSFKEACLALRRWYELLMSGGVLVLETPDFKRSCLEFATHNFVDEIPELENKYPILDRLMKQGDWGIYTTWGRMRNIFGAQDEKDTPEVALGQYHKSGWWKNRLFDELAITGFEAIQTWRSCEEGWDAQLPHGLKFSSHSQEEPVILARATK